MASHAIFQYNVLAIDDIHNTWTNMIVKMTMRRHLGCFSKTVSTWTLRLLLGLCLLSLRDLVHLRRAKLFWSVQSACVAKMASHAIFQYNVLAIDDIHNTWTNMIIKMTKKK